MKIHRFDANNDLTPADLEAMRELVRSLGHASDDIAAKFAVSDDGIGVRLHLSEHVRNEEGFKLVDLAADHIVTRPHEHDISPEQLPPGVYSVLVGFPKATGRD